MRYSEAHAAKSGSVPFALRGPKSMRTVMATIVAGAVGFMPVVLSPSAAQAVVGDYTLVGSSSGNEGSSVNFNITRGSSTGIVGSSSLDWEVSIAPGDTATLADFSQTSGTVTFAADSEKKVISIPTVGNDLDEDDKTFTLKVTGAGMGEEWDSAGTILDDDAAPGFTLDWDTTTPKEGTNSSVTVKAILNAKSGKNVEIPIAITPGTALAGQDYTDLSPTAKLTVTAGDPSSSEVSIDILNDVLYEDPQQDFVLKTTASSTVTGTQQTTVNITDNESQSVVSVSKPDAVVEGNQLAFNVSVSPISEKSFTVSYATADGAAADLTATEIAKGAKATAGSDYTSTTGTLTFPKITGPGTPEAVKKAAPAAVSQTVNVKTSVDDVYETSPEYLNLALSAPTVAKLAAPPAATGSINDGTNAPTVTFTPDEITETNATVDQTFTVKLSSAAQKKITVNYLVDKLSRFDAPSYEAVPGSDFIATQGSLVFNPGDTSKTFSVKIVGDHSYEPTELLGIGLSSADLSNTMTPWSDVYDITVKDDDPKPTYSIAPVVMKEGNDASVAMFPIKLSNPIGLSSTWDVTFSGSSTATDSGDRPGETDYLPPSGQVTIPANQTTGYLYFLVNGDTVYENDETLAIKLEPNGVSHTDDWVTGNPKNTTLSLTNDDAAPSLEINSVTGNEGDMVQVTGITSGATQVAVPLNVTFKATSVNGKTAAAPSDFIDPGMVSVTIPARSFSGSTVEVGDPVELIDDELKEPDETILVSGTGLAGVGKVIDGVLTIAASDGGTPTTPTDPGSVKPTIMAPASVKGTGPVTVTGKASPKTSVELWAWAVGSKSTEWMSWGTTTTAADGSYSFTKSINQGVKLKVTAGKDLVSPEITVWAQQAPVFVATSPSKGWLKLAVQGTPRGEDQKVTVQRWTGKTWVTVWTGETGSNDQWSATVKQVSGSKWTLRALVGAAPEWGIQAGYSVNRTVTIK